MKSEDVKRFGKECGADLVGIGNIERFEGAPKQCDPRHIMPEAKSIVVLGFRIFRGLLRGIEEGTFFQNYSSLGYAAINTILQPMTLWKFCQMFEDDGYEALPIHNSFEWTALRTNTGLQRKDWSRPVAPGKPYPDVFLHMRIAAYVAGLGEIGYSKVFLTPEFGPRVRLAAVLTEAELEPDPLVKPGTICDRCMACVRDCSGKAISRHKTVKVTVAGQDLEWGELDIYRCASAFQGIEYDEKQEIYAPRDGRKTDHNPFCGDPSAQNGYGRAIEGAAGCIRACMIHLESQGKLSNKFRQQFRRRPEWHVDWNKPVEEPFEDIHK